VNSFQRVFDKSDRRIRGLWERNGSFYVQAMVADPETGLKKNNRIRLEGAANRTEAIKAMYDVLKGIKAGEIASTKSAPDFKTFREHYGKVAGNPHATPFLIHILVAVAEHERNMISSRTKSALDAARARGVKFGNPLYEEAIPKANEAWKAIAADRNAGLRKVVAEVMEKTGLTKLAEIAEALNLRGIKTNRGCGFTPTHIHRLLKAA